MASLFAVLMVATAFLLVLGDAYSVDDTYSYNSDAPYEAYTEDSHSGITPRSGHLTVPFEIFNGRPHSTFPPFKIPVRDIDLSIGEATTVIVDFWPGYTAGNWPAIFSTITGTWHPLVIGSDTGTHTREMGFPIEYYSASFFVPLGTVPPIRENETSFRVQFMSIQLGMEPLLDLNDFGVSDFRRAVVGEYVPNIPAQHTQPVSIRNLRAPAVVAPVELGIRPNSISNNRYFTLDIPSAGGPVYNHLTDFIARATNAQTPGPAATIDGMPFNIVPKPNLGPGSYSNMVWLWQDANDRYGDPLPRAYLNIPYFDSGQPGTLAAVPNNPLRNHRGEFEVRFEVLRPATAVVIPVAEGPARNTTVHVGYTYRNPNPLPDSYTYNNGTPGFSYTIINHPNARDIRVTIPPPRYTFFDFYENDPLRRPICRDTGDPLPITPPANHAVISSTVDLDGNLVVDLRPLHTLTFILDGGNIEGNPSTVIRTNRLQGTPVQLGNGDPVTGHPVAYPAFDTTAMPQRGVPQPNPVLNHRVFLGWQELDQSNDPIGPVLLPFNLSTQFVTDDRTFIARWHGHCFIKTYMYIYDDPPVVVPLDNVRFAVYEFEDCPENGLISHGRIYTTELSGSCGTDGRVELNVNFRPDRIYHLVEIETPSTHMLQTGHWRLVFDEHGIIRDFVPYNGNLPFVPIYDGSSLFGDDSVINYAPYLVMDDADDYVHYGDIYEQYEYDDIIVLDLDPTPTPTPIPTPSPIPTWHVGNEEIDEPVELLRVTFFPRGGDIPGYGNVPVIREDIDPGTWIIDVIIPDDPVPPVLPSLGNNVVFHGWREVHADGSPMYPGLLNYAWLGSAPLAPNDPQLTDSPVYQDRYFEAVYGYWFEFIKTNLRIEEDPPVVEPLDGAVFYLYVQDFGVWDDSDPFNVVFIPGPPVYMSEPSGFCGTPGRVTIGYNQYSKALEVRYDGSGVWSWPLVLTLQRHLREWEAPPRHILPVSPWWHVDLQYTGPGMAPGPFLPHSGGFWGLFPNVPSWWDAQMGGGMLADAPPMIIIDNVPHIRNQPIPFMFFKATRYPHHRFPATDDWEWKVLPGAVFVLERMEGGDWIPVYTSQPSCAEGKVYINYLLPINSASEYRLVEIVAPVGFNLPHAGGWLITTNNNGEVISLEFEQCNFWIHLHFDGEYVSEDGWFVPNIPTREWPVYKTDWYLYTDPDNLEYLEGAEFRLYVYNGPMEPAPPLEMITNDMVGPADQGYMWSYVTTRTSGPAGSPMMFPMMLGRHYQLVEVAPPLGFDLPFGQWRLQVTTFDSFPEGQFIYPDVVSNAPPPIIIDRPEYIAGIGWHPNPHVYIGNRPQVELPMSGGLGIGVFTIAGFALLGGAGVLIVYQYIKKRKTSAYARPMLAR